MSKLVPVPSIALVDTRSASEVAHIVRHFETLPALKHVEPDIDGPQAAQVRKWLAVIGSKSWPTMAADPRTDWLNAMVFALSDLPGALAVAALKDAVHQPFRFHNEVEPWVRERAVLIRKRVNLLPWQAERRTREEQPQLEAPGTRWTQQEVDDANATFEAIGVDTRYRLVGDQVEKV
jgi:hypothetical protein